MRKKVSAALVCEESWRAFAQSLIAVFANKTTAIREQEGELFPGRIPIPVFFAIEFKAPELWVW